MRCSTRERRYLVPLVASCVACVGVVLAQGGEDGAPPDPEPLDPTRIPERIAPPPEIGTDGPNPTGIGAIERERPIPGTVPPAPAAEADDTIPPPPGDPPRALPDGPDPQPRDDDVAPPTR